MTKYINLKFAVCVFVMLLLVCGSAWCEDIKGRWGVGYRYGFVNPDDDDFKSHGNAHYLNLTYGLTENIAVEAEGGYFRLKSKAGSEIGVYSLHADIQLRANLKRLAPYILGGIGFQGYKYDNIGSGDRKDKNISFSYEAGVGTEYFLSKNWALNLEAVYIYGNTGGNATLDVYSWQYGGGIKYYF